MPVQARWYGVEPTSSPNISLVIKDINNLSSSFEVIRRGIQCRVTPSGSKWPACALRATRTCERVCEPAFNRSNFPLYLRAKGRPVLDWSMRTTLEAAPPPQSPACGMVNGEGRCGEEMDIELVPHGQTNVRVGSFPVA